MVEGSIRQTGSRRYRQQVRHQLWWRCEGISGGTGWNTLRYPRLYTPKREIQSSCFACDTNCADPEPVCQFHRVRFGRCVQVLREEVAASPDEPKRSTYAGLFLTTLSLLQFELFLTRIFSVTMWYHFAFMAISLAMFGLAAGAIFIELMKKRDPHATLRNLALLFALTSAICFAGQLYIPADPEKEIAWTVLAFTLVAIPFVCGGMVVCVALTRFSRRTGVLYAADLAGSAAGCLLAIPILNHIHAPTAVILNASIAALAAVAFGWSTGRTRRLAAGCAALLFGIAAVNQSSKLIDIQWVKGGKNWHGALYEKWNALSRITVRRAQGPPFGWGMSPVYRAKQDIEQLYVDIDSGAATVITKFDGNLDGLEHLKYDVTSLAHYLRTPV